MRRYIRPRFTQTGTVRWPVTVLQDDRERQPFSLSPDYFVATRKRLPVGDYTFAGLEKIVAIERKNGLAEIVSDLSGANRARFVRFLSRMQQYPIRIMLVESAGPDDTYDMPDYRGFGRNATINTVHHWLAEITLRYQIPILFLGNRRELQHRLLDKVFQRAYMLGAAYRR